MILSGSADYTKGLGCSLVSFKKRLMAGWRATIRAEDPAFGASFGQFVNLRERCADFDSTPVLAAKSGSGARDDVPLGPRFPLPSVWRIPVSLFGQLPAKTETTSALSPTLQANAITCAFWSVVRR
jgi:hypothetical protein